MHRKTFMLFMLAALVSFPLAAQETPSAPKAQAPSKQNLDDSNLPHRQPIKTLFLNDNTEVQVYSNGVSEADSSRLFYLAKPEIIVDPNKCYDAKTKELNFDIRISANANEIREQLNAQGFDTKYLVQMPVKGYKIVVSVGNDSQEIKKYKGDVEIENINCSEKITEPRIVQTLEKDVKKLNVEVTFFVEFKRTYGESVRMGFASKLAQHVQEKVLGDKNEVLISRASFDGIYRDASYSVNSSLRNEGYILYLGEGAERLMTPFLEQNKNLFAEKALGDMEKITDSLVLYSLENGRKELEADKIEEFINDYEKLDESRKHFKKVWKNLKEIRNQSKDVNDFKERSLKEIHIDGEVDGSYCWGFIDAGLEFSFDGKWENETSKYTYSWKDLYDKAAQESFSEEEFFEKRYEKIKGEIRKFYTRPKEYRVMRIGSDSINTSTEFYAQNATIVNVFLPKTFPTTLGKAIEKAEKRKQLEAEQVEIAKLKNEIATLKTYPGARMIKVINGVGFAFRWCPPGTFQMGSPESEYKKIVLPEHQKLYDEKQHQVTLTQGFWMLESEVTQGQWQAVMGYNPSQHKGGKYFPVENVSFNECQEFCKKCAQLGLPIQLPTEAQWEYACRAGADGKPTMGSIETAAWCGANSGGATHGVGQKCPNYWGLYDMYGNVWEWCTDWLAFYPSEPQVNPTGPENGKLRVLRGLSYQYPNEVYRSTTRGFNFDNVKDPSFGFRVIIVP